MTLASFVVSCLLATQVAGGPGTPPPPAAKATPTPAAQAPAGPSPAAGAAKSAAPNLAPGEALPASKPAAPAAPPKSSGGVVPAQSAGNRATELVASLVNSPTAGTLTGRPLALQEALSAAPDRTRQLDIVHAYWDLTAAVGEYHARFETVQALRRLEPKAADATVVRGARASALAALQKAEDAVLRSQRRLSERASLATNLPMPLPSDPPHVGAYRTAFDELSTSQTLPPRARLLHRSLPVRRSAIDLRADAVQFAEDAALDSLDSYRSGAIDVAAVLSGLEDLTEQRRTLVADVVQYNHEIADYALSVVTSPATGLNVVRLLIKATPQVSLPAGAPKDSPTIAPTPDKRTWLPDSSGAQPATYLQSVPAWGAPPQSDAQPTLAPPRDASQSGGVSPKGYVPRYDSQVDPRIQEPTLAPPQGSDAAPLPRTANRLIADLADAGISGGAPASAAFYADLAGKSPAVQATLLSRRLHSSRNLPPQAGQPSELQEYLQTVVGNDRRGAIDAYWLAAQRAAEYLALAQQAEFLQQLAPLAVEQGAKPGGAARMLRLQAARRAADADLLDAQVNLLEAQFDMSRRIVRPLTSPWLLAASPPHAGLYEAVQSQSPAVRRSEEIIRDVAESMKNVAAAVVATDGVRATAIADFQRGGAIEPALACVRCQTLETIAFVATVGAYNRAIGEYALALEPNIRTDELVRRLIVVPRSQP